MRKNNGFLSTLGLTKQLTAVFVSAAKPAPRNAGPSPMRSEIPRKFGHLGQIETHWPRHCNNIRQERRETFMRNLKNISFALCIASTLSLGLVGCGGQAYRAVDNVGQPNNGNTGNLTDFGGGSGGSDDSDDSNDGSDQDSPTAPAYTYDFAVTGSGGTTPSWQSPLVETDNLLKVRVSAGNASRISLPSGYSNFTATYGCVQYTIRALGQTVTTGLLSTGSASSSVYCPNAPTSQVIDFSSRLGSGHNSVNIEVTEVRYDFYCQMLMQGLISSMYYNTYCPSYPVYRTHTVTGQLDIQVNGTSL